MRFLFRMFSQILPISKQTEAAFLGLGTLPLRVAVFAHNEAKRIARCLDSVYRAAPNTPMRIDVLANGCSDCTVDVVRAYAATHPEVTVRDISLADKANAWNVFVHELASQSPSAYLAFLDGDCHAAPLAIDHLIEALSLHQEANAAAALPVAGRSMKKVRRQMVSEREIAGNLYVLRGDFVTRIVRARIHMPVGLIGDDTLVGAMVKFDLDAKQEWRDERVVAVQTAGFSFDSIRATRFTEIRTYFNRKVRYSLRRYQFLALRDVFRLANFDAMPERIEELYGRGHPSWRITCRGFETFFDWLALGRIRRVKASEINGRRSRRS